MTGLILHGDALAHGIKINLRLQMRWYLLHEERKFGSSALIHPLKVSLP